MSFIANTAISAVEGFAGFDSLFRRSVTKVIPRFQQLIDHPADYLAAEDVRIGPSIRWVTGIFFGTLFGVNLSCGIAFTALDSSKPIALRSQDEQWLFWLIVVSGPLLFSAIFLYWLRGGDVFLRKDGVEFRFRQRRVVCPWALFNAPGSPEWLDRFTLAMAASPGAIDEAKLIVEGSEVSTGIQIRTRQFRFRPPETTRITKQADFPEIALRDLYKARLNEIASLILILSRDLGKPSSSGELRK